MSHISRQIILHIIDEQHPSSVGRLGEILKSRGIEFTDQELLDYVSRLTSEGVLALGNPRPLDFLGFLAEYNQTSWIYVTVMIPLVESFLVLFDSQNPILVFFRLILGVLLLAFLPGYCGIRALFPQKSPALLERVILSIFLSLIISISIGTILGSVLLFESATNVLLLTSITILLAVTAAYRNFNSLKS